MALTLRTDRMSAVKPSATLAAAGRAKALQRQGKDIINLTAGEPDFKTPTVITDAAARALADRSSHAYTAARGTDELIAAMQQKLLREQKVRYAETEVIATVGTKGGLMMAIDALVGAGDEVILFAPYWVTYADLVRLAGATPVIVHTRRDHGYTPSLADVEAAITDKTKLIILNSPSNPAGAGWPEALLRQIMKRLEGTDIWVISDEIYEKLTYDGFEHVSPAAFSDDARGRTLYCGGVAKAYAMTGWRVGVAAGPKLLVDALLTLQQQRTTCPAAISQVAAAYALREDDGVPEAVAVMRAAYAKRRALVMERVQAIPGAFAHKPEGAFYVFVDLTARLPGVHGDKRVDNDVELAGRLLDDVGLAVVAGSAFEGPGCLRVSYAASEDTLNQGFDRLARFLDGLKAG